GRIWQGSPARDVGSFDTRNQPPRPAVSKNRLRAETLFFTAGILLIATLFFIPVFPTFFLMDWFDAQHVLPWLAGTSVGSQLARYFMLAFPASAVLIVATALASAALRWIALPRLKPGR
ncbi:hypothetical protein, partial [Pseudomonas viridiflava]|uniref:hypothetical protein n=1 Tax=Pseudomonas viridiflava TaxID=33069 RepID=UPI0013CF7355